MVIEVAVAGAVLQQVGVGSGGGDAAVFEVDDEIGVDDGVQVVGDDDGGTSGHESS